MSRKEASNTWHDGLVMDLNPMNTPNSVLTDNLNGTIITYNGNEHLLQNDMGNYKLKNCKLSENFVPVGLKEYGDILYIVSYNPITEETEVGSYPSPAQINSATPATIEDEGRQSVILKSLQQHPKLEYHHTDENNYSVVFADEKMKMHPGDKYDLKRVTSEDFPKYEGNDYYILDEENRFHEITDFVERDLNDKGYKFVPWDVPGWLCIKSKVFNFDKYTMSITEFDKYNEKLAIGIRNKLYVNDPIFINKYLKYLKHEYIVEDLIQDISIDLKIFIDGNSAKAVQLSRKLSDSNLVIQSYEWYNNGVIIQFDYKTEFQINTTGSTMIKIVTTPILSELDKYSITYSHLTQTIESNIDSIVSATASSIKASGEYKFYRDNSAEDSSGTGSVMKLFVDLVAASDDIVVVEDDFQLYLTLFDLNEKVKSSIPLQTEITIGQNGIPVTNELEFTLLPELREQIYYVTLSSTEITSTFDEAVKSGTEFIKFENSTKYVLITSTVFQKYMEEYDDFTKIPMKTWVEDYLSQISSDSNLQVSNVTKEDQSYGSDYVTNDVFRGASDDFVGFVKSSVQENLDPEVARLSVNYTISFEISGNTIEENIKKYIIGMWSKLLASSNNYTIVVTDEEGLESEIDIQTSDDEQNDSSDDNDFNDDWNNNWDNDDGDNDWNKDDKTPLPDLVFPWLDKVPEKDDSNSDEDSKWPVSPSLPSIKFSMRSSNYGTWSTNTAKKVGNKITFNTNYILQKEYDFEFITSLEKFCPYSIVDFTKKFNKNGWFKAMSYTPNWTWTAGSGSTVNSGQNVKVSFNRTTNPSEKLLSTSDVGYITGYIGLGSGGTNLKITKKSGNSDTTIIHHTDNTDGWISSPIYFLAIKANDNTNRFVFIHRESASSSSSISNDLSGSKWVYSSGETPTNYIVYRLIDGDVTTKYSNPILKYNLKPSDTWSYCNKDLLKLSVENFEILTMSDWQPFESNLQTEVQIDFYPKESEFPFVKGDSGLNGISDYDTKVLNVNNQIANKIGTINSEIDLTRDDFRGFYPSSTNFAKNLANYLVYKDGTVKCNFNSSDFLKLVQISYGDAYTSNIGYCLEI